MLLLLLAIGIGLIVLDAICDFNDNPCAFGGIFIVIISLIVLCIVGGLLVNTRTIDAKLEMYQSENNYIQQEVSATVEGYKEYESGVFENVKTDSPIVLVNLFPELKANELVNKQIEVYISNNQKIKELKEKQINASNYKWWIYFGG